MDTIATVSYTSDPINRECTSYAYWYFTSIEGHANFRAWGNAKYWATSSNYPTHAVPAVGAIAVETAGAYGHVAIVQALPGQKYAEQVVPAGYVLVSEMNYDWHGHFRYSYSPLSKFTAYIYP
jgi:surface antigen